MVSGIISADEFIAAVKLDRVRTAVVARFWASAFVLLGSLLFISKENQVMGFALVVLGLIGWSFELYFAYIYLPRVVRKRIADVPEMRGETSYAWDTEALHAWNAITDSRRPWRDFKGFKETDSLLLLYVADGVYQVFPKRWFSDPEILGTLRSLVNDIRI
jgi:YcxB-like protein